MGFPLINKQAPRQVNIPDLSGGINLRDAMYSINDNQLTDCKNVWFKDGTLKTRPGSRKSTDLEAFASYKSDARTQAQEWDIYRTYDDVRYKLHTLAVQNYGKDEEGNIILNSHTQFYLIPENSTTEIKRTRILGLFYVTEPF